MNLSSEILPAGGVRVLVWDRSHKQWKIGHLRMHDNTQFWVFDPKIFHSLDSNRFPGWLNLPENLE